MAIKRGGVKLTKRQQAAYVRELTGWSRAEYQKEYDKLRNRVRNYERATSAEEHINVADLLARHARGEYYARVFGETYRPSELWQAVQKAPAVSTGRALSEEQISAAQQANYDYVNRRYKGIVEKSKFSGDIEAALREYSETHNGERMPAAQYQKLVEDYARALDQEREDVENDNAALSDNLPDAAKQRFFHSS